MAENFDWSCAPPAVAHLRQWLIAQEFLVVRAKSSGYANQLIRYESETRIVSISVDRGDWSLTIGLDGMDAQFHPDEWEAWLDGFDLAGDLSSLDKQVEFVTERWADAIERAAMNLAAESEIREIGRDYVSRRFGFRL